MMVTANKIPVAVTHDGRTLRYPDPDVKVNDSVKVNIATGKMSDILTFELGAMVMIVRGGNTGRIGQLMHVEKHEGSFDIVTIKDVKGNTFATRLTNIFIIGSGNQPQLTLPKGRGIKKTILQERAEAEARGDL
uniref:KOW domain-containing protein n=1 Tax=Grammatophora oceanica TaxID=210454 RepID=A0A7S1Y1Z2_9STRA|mmetsp:Transcript_19473/g.28811  ORF Transcript_19473/g.28811 Transcript_19473/m.28811 type:complete len:134 (+) Transcript_19473:615-1016(+)